MTSSLGIGVLASRDPSGVTADEALSGITHGGPLTVRRTLSTSERDQLLAELLRLYHSVVWRMLRRLGVQTERVDDAAQEVFIVLARKLEYIEPGRERRYLLNSAIRIAANYRRTAWARREVLSDHVLEERSDPVPDADRLLDQKRLRQLLDDVLSGWPEEIRTVFVLFELEGMSVPEIAELTETKLGTVASRLRRARELFLSATKRLRARGLIEEESS